MTKLVPCGGCGEVDETKRCVGCLHQFHQPEEQVTAYGLLAQAMESLGERLLDDTFGYDWKEGLKSVLAQGEPTYCTSQHTKCAVCLEDKHTPLRIDSMGGYVCLTCIDRKLTGLIRDQNGRGSLRTKLMHAATSCPHEIDSSKVILHHDPKQEGHNALAQLANRLAQAVPAPTEGLQPADIEALKAAVAAIYFADSSDYLSALWSVVRALSPNTASILERNGSEAFEKVNSLQSIAGETVTIKGRRTGLATLEALTAQVEQLTQERDEADRRAGAAERRQASTSDSLFKLNHWRDKQKVMAGYSPNVSFDIVWAETLEKANKAEEASRLLKMLVEEQRLKEVFYPAHNAALKFLNIPEGEEG